MNDYKSIKIWYLSDGSRRVSGKQIQHYYYIIIIITELLGAFLPFCSICYLLAGIHLSIYIQMHGH